MSANRAAFRGLLNATLAVGATLAVTVPAMVGSTPTMQPGEYWSATPTQVQDREDFNRAHPNQPVWTSADARTFPACVAYDETVLADLIVVRLDGTHEPMDFDEALARNTNASKVDNVWPIGTCPAS